MSDIQDFFREWVKKARISEHVPPGYAILWPADIQWMLPYDKDAPIEPIDPISKAQIFTIRIQYEWPKDNMDHVRDVVRMFGG